MPRSKVSHARAAQKRDGCAPWMPFAAHIDAHAMPRTPSAIDRKTKWREALILEFRATRKRALRHAINRFSGVPAAEVDRSEL